MVFHPLRPVLNYIEVRRATRECQKLLESELLTDTVTTTSMKISRIPIVVTKEAMFMFILLHVFALSPVAAKLVGFLTNLCPLHV